MPLWLALVVRVCVEVTNRVALRVAVSTDVFVTVTALEFEGDAVCVSRRVPDLVTVTEADV